MNPRALHWEIDEDDLGVLVVRHQHAGAWATGYVFSEPHRAWAECSTCGEELGLVMRMADPHLARRAAE
jgi:hypothetical protein